MLRKILFVSLVLLIEISFFPSIPVAIAQTLNIEDAVINVAATAGKAVVSISTEHITKIGGGKKRYSFSPFGGGESPFEDDEFFRRFFDDFFGEIPEREYKQVGLGSGVIIDAEGYILTNEHVVDDADKITVTLPDGREFKGEMKGKDPRSDLAVIKINAHNLPAAVLGDSDNLRIGQWVVAIGNPFGFALQGTEPTVTTGVISALHRSLGRTASRDKDYNDLIQTDAAINPGNSGGPLVNLKGEIVGINVAIFSTSGGYQGIGFAIPVNSAKRVISRLIAGKKVVYGWLGVTVQDLSEDLMGYFGFPDKSGALVVSVLKDSPADKAGIKESDCIKEFDNAPINNVRELLSNVAKVEVGKRVKVGVLRDKKELSLEVKIEERPQDMEEAGEAPSKEAAKESWRGLKVIEENKAVAVSDVEANSPAERAGIIPGDIILEINRRSTNNLSEYKNIVKSTSGNALVRTQRGYFIIKENSGE